MADAWKLIGGVDFKLSGSGVTSTATSIIVEALEFPDGTDITMAMFGGTIGFATLEPKVKSKKEFISFSGITNNGDGTWTLTGVTRGLKPYTPFDQDLNLRYSHAGATTLIFSNPPQVYDKFAAKDNDETITGDWLVPAPATNSSVINKLYADSLAIAGAPDMTTTQKGIAEEATLAEIDADTAAGSVGRLAINPSTLATSKYGTRLPSSAQKDALAGGGALGTPSTSNKFQTQDGVTAAIAATTNPIHRVYGASNLGDTTSQFDITNPSGTTARYTYDGTGTNPGITASTVPTGATVIIVSDSMTLANTGKFTVTNSGSNFFEVTNAAVVAETNKTLALGFLQVSFASTWTKPAGLKYVRVRVQGAGGAGGGDDSTQRGGAAGGAGGGYAEKIIAAASLGATETATPGAGGTRGTTGATGTDGGTGGTSSFGSHVSATGGSGGQTNDSGDIWGGSGGTGVGGDLNCVGGSGSNGWTDAGSDSTTLAPGTGGNSVLGGGGHAPQGSSTGLQGIAGSLYGGGGGGGDAGNQAGFGGGGAVIIEEYFS